MAEKTKDESGGSVAGSGGEILFSQRWLQLGWGFGLGLFLLVGLVLAETAAGVRRDSVREVTGLGDPVVFELPSARLGEEVAKVSGRSLVLAENREQSFADLEMRRIATDSRTGLSVYQRAEGKERPGTYFLKLSPGVYLKVRLGR